MGMKYKHAHKQMNLFWGKKGEKKHRESGANRSKKLKC